MPAESHAYFPRRLPAGLEPLAELALDLRWTWSHSGDHLWEMLDPDAWQVTENPWVILQNVSEDRLERLADDHEFRTALAELSAHRDDYLAAAGLLPDSGQNAPSFSVAYFSMEFGLGPALPLYAGGLGVLAGDYLKTASDLGVSVVGVGLLFQEGYFRQTIDRNGRQAAVYTYNEPSMMPIQPVSSLEGGWLRVPLEFPGRRVMLRVWRANVGRVSLYLLDSNDPFNAPIDRGITAKLYGDGRETRLMQQIVLGIGGWRMLTALGLDIQVCHINEGHAALAILERARQHMRQSGVGFREALRATRAGNVFTTHTPVASGFETFDSALILKYLPFVQYLASEVGVSVDEILALGRAGPGDSDEPFNMAYLAMSGSTAANAVSRLHGEVSRRIFGALYPRWPGAEVPLGHVTNGIHVPSWDSPWADRLWTAACGQDRWRGTNESLDEAIHGLDDQTFWSFCARERQDLVRYVRRRYARQLRQRGEDPEVVRAAEQALDPNLLMIGFARRFATYKRPNLLLHDLDRLERLVMHPERPVQIIIAGKAHPDDGEAQSLIQDWIAFASRPGVRDRVVFLEDYEISLAQQLVQGVDVWVNTPRRPWEACGTSGMKVLVNGGLNLSVLDGWWAEAYTPEVGWAVDTGSRTAVADADRDRTEALSLYRILEDEVTPLFYDRDPGGIPQGWVKRMRTSMSRLAPGFSSIRMMEEYFRDYYGPAARAFEFRRSDGGRRASELEDWYQRTHRNWPRVHFGEVETHLEESHWRFRAQVYLCDLSPEEVSVQVFAAGSGRHDSVCEPMEVVGTIPGSVGGYIFQGRVAAARPENDYSARVIPFHPDARVPIENSLILWQR